MGPWPLRGNALPMETTLRGYQMSDQTWCKNRRSCKKRGAICDGARPVIAKWFHFLIRHVLWVTNDTLLPPSTTMQSRNVVFRSK